MTIREDWRPEDAKKFDILIIGSGPAAFFAALTLVEKLPKLKIAILEKDKVLGGSGARSDGKLTKDATGRVGGYLLSDDHVEQQRYEQLMEEVEEVYVRFGGNRDRMFGHDENHQDVVEELVVAAQANKSELHTFPITHLGTDTAQMIVDNVFAYLREKGVQIFIETMALKIINDVEANRHGVIAINCEREYYFSAEHIIVAPGRSGSKHAQEMLSNIGVQIIEGMTDIGVRVECPNKPLKKATDIFYELKCYTTVEVSHGKHVGCRTFCMCPEGLVSVETPKHVHDAQYYIANGHTFADPDKHSDNCNFAFLATVAPPTGMPSLDFIENVASRCSDAAHGRGVIVQKFSDFLEDRASTMTSIMDGKTQPAIEDESRAVAGDLTRYLPTDVVAALKVGLTRFLHIFGVEPSDTLVYGSEVKAYASRMKLNSRQGFESTVPRIYGAGDGSGLTRGLCQASMMGIIVAQHITGIYDN